MLRPYTPRAAETIDRAISEGKSLSISRLIGRQIYAADFEYALRSGAAPLLTYAVERGARLHGTMLAQTRAGETVRVRYRIVDYEDTDEAISEAWGTFRRSVYGRKR